MITDFELASLKDRFLSGVLVGIGSLVLKFSDDAEISLSCPFALEDSDGRSTGHGEDPYSSGAMFQCLNKNVVRVIVSSFGALRISFEGGACLLLEPEDDGLEAYVVSIDGEVFPVSFAMR